MMMSSILYPFITLTRMKTDCLVAAGELWACFRPQLYRLLVPNNNACQTLNFIHAPRLPGRPCSQQSAQRVSCHAPELLLILSQHVLPGALRPTATSAACVSARAAGQPPRLPQTLRLTLAQQRPPRLGPPPSRAMSCAGERSGAARAASGAAGSSRGGPRKVRLVRRLACTRCCSGLDAGMPWSDCLGQICVLRDPD